MPSATRVLTSTGRESIPMQTPGNAKRIWRKKGVVEKKKEGGRGSWFAHISWRAFPDVGGWGRGEQCGILAFPKGRLLGWGGKADVLDDELKGMQEVLTSGRVAGKAHEGRMFCDGPLAKGSQVKGL